MDSQKHIKLLVDVVSNPGKWYWVANTPSSFDAAEYLMENHWDSLSRSVQEKIEQILLKSGRYIKTV